MWGYDPAVAATAMMAPFPAAVGAAAAEDGGGCHLNSAAVTDRLHQTGLHGCPAATGGGSSSSSSSSSSSKTQWGGVEHHVPLKKCPYPSSPTSLPLDTPPRFDQ